MAKVEDGKVTLVSTDGTNKRLRRFTVDAEEIMRINPGQWVPESGEIAAGMRASAEAAGTNRSPAQQATVAASMFLKREDVTEQIAKLDPTRENQEFVDLLLRVEEAKKGKKRRMVLRELENKAAEIAKAIADEEESNNEDDTHEAQE